jgi:hypothetical protein
LKLTVHSTTKAVVTGTACVGEPSGLVVTASGSVANNGAGNLTLTLSVRNAHGSTVVLAGSDHERTISATTTTFKVDAHLSSGATPASCTLDVNPA